MDLKEISKEFLDWENRNRLYDIKLNEFPIYTFVRMEIYESIIFKSDLSQILKKGASKQVKKINYWELIKSCLGFFTKQHILKNSNLYITNTENKLKFKNVYVDNFFDKIIQNDTSKTAVLEFPNLINYHFKNIQNKKITVKGGLLYLLEKFLKGNVDIPKLDNKIAEISKQYVQLYENIHGECEEKGFEVEIKNRILTNLRRVNIYKNFITKYKPKVVYIKSAYSPMKQIFVFLCKTENIKVFEVQHGHIYPYHIGYLLPKSNKVAKDLFPDKIFVWSNYYKNILLNNNWQENQILVSGDFTYNNEISQEKHIDKNEYSYITSKFDNIITIISQHTLCDEINQFLKNVGSIPAKTAVLIKLHPKYQMIQEKSFSSILKNKNVILLKEGNIKSCLRISDLVIGVYSTAVIEAIEMNKEVHLINASMSDFFEDLIETKVVQKSNSIFDSYKMQENTFKHTQVVFREPFNLV